MQKRDRIDLGKKRITSILRPYVVASMRTLENKISDAGPPRQRVNPHILTTARQELQQEGKVLALSRQGLPWYHLSQTTHDDLQRRLSTLVPLHRALQRRDLTTRIGQALEIAVYKALITQDALTFFGSFADLDEHDDSLPYSKIEPPSSLSGRSLPGQQKLDFLVHDTDGFYGGVEVKNIREWLYPDRDEIRDLLSKCCQLDVVPILIARRLPYVTSRLLIPCGVLVHETYNQRLPQAEADLATDAMDKNLLGFHDIRLGNEPDKRLIRFVHDLLPKLIPEARDKFDDNRALLCEFANQEISYDEFSQEARQI